MSKTNAVRILQTAGIDFSVKEYDISDGRIDGISVADKLGCPRERVFKTLVTEGKTAGVAVFVIPVEYELDVRKAAKAAGDKYIEMIKARELEPKTGYIHGGCSPVGIKKVYPTFIEETAQLHDTIVVSAGRVGLQIELHPSDLASACGAVFADLI